MNVVIRDHIASGLFKDVDYRAIKEPGQEIDFLIRYYPGKTAQQSMSRVLAGLNAKPTLPQPAPRKKRKSQSIKNPSVSPQSDQFDFSGEGIRVQFLLAAP